MSRAPGTSAPGPFYLLLLLLACGPPAVEVPPPSGLENLDDAVRSQYLERRQTLDDTLGHRRASAADRAAAYGDLGRWYHLYGFPDEAEISYDAAIALAAEDARWPYYLAHLHKDHGRLDPSRRFFQRVRELEPDDVPAIAWLAEIERLAGDTGRARDLYRRALELDPGCVLATVGLGILALERGDLDRARELLERGDAAQPGVSAIRYPLGQTYRRLGRHDQAAVYLADLPEEKGLQGVVRIRDPRMDALERQRESYVGHLREAGRALREGRNADAVERFRRAIAADADNLEARLQLAAALRQQGRGRAAIRELEEALERFPEHPRGLYHLGQALAEDGRLPLAEAHLRAAIAADPRHKHAEFLLAQILLSDGRAEEAARRFARTRELDPRVARAAHGQAAALVDLGRFPQAVRVLETALRAAPGNRELTALLARVLATAPEAASRRPQQALALARALADPDVHAAESLAMAWAAAGGFEQAVAWQRAAIAAIEDAASPRCHGGIARSRLARYRNRRPSGGPWAAGEAICEATVLPPPEVDRG